jgi:hypothetical protein
VWLQKTSSHIRKIIFFYSCLVSVTDDPLIEELHVVADPWGTDPVHPATDTYHVMAEKLEEEMMRPVSSFSNSATGSGPRRPVPDMAEHRQYWVESCSAALPRNGGARARYPSC